MPRHRPGLAVLLSTVWTLAVVLVPSALQAQEAPATRPAPGVGLQPYKLVAITPPAAYEDESFAAFRKFLAEVAQRRIFAELERSVVARGFFWERDFAGTYDARRSAAENLAAAIRLERGSGAGWQWLADMVADASASPMPSRPGVVCAPGRPQFDAFEFDWLLEVTHSARTDWGYPRAGDAEVRAQPQARGQIVGKVGSHFVRLLAAEGGNDVADATGAAWVRVATPSGQSGFVAPGRIAPAYPPRLCYGKDALGRWSIAGFVGAGE
jgi:hypothetical protein